MLNYTIPGVEIYPNFLNNNFIRFALEKADNDWTLKVNTVNNEIKRRSSSIQLSEIIHLDKKTKEFYEFFLNELQTKIEDYKNKYFIKNLIPEYLNNMPVVTLLKYEQGDEIHYHSDSHEKDNRIATAIAYFNDDYTGGSLDFQFFNYSLKPSPGSLVLSPANYPYSHRSSVIKNGTKYAVRCFLVSS